MSKLIEIDATKRGLPAIWETGGGLTSGGSATIIAKSDGSKPRAVFVRTRGHLAGGPHALICVHEGFYLVHASVGRGVRQSARIERIVKTSVEDVHGEKYEATAEVEVFNTFSRGEWDKPLDAKLEDAVEAAFGKASTYHCRCAAYIDTSERAPESEEKRKRREAEMAKQDAERARLRAEKAAVEAKAEAEAEAASRAALPGLLPRLSMLVDRVVSFRDANPDISYAKLTLGDSRFSLGWSLEEALYTDENVGKAERIVTGWEDQIAERQRNAVAKAEFQPQFEALSSRAEALGLMLSFGEERVNWSGSYYGSAYTQEALDSFVSYLLRKEEEKATKEREEAAAEAKAQAEAEAATLGLPSSVTIWYRLGGVTNRGSGWVLRPDGSERDSDRMDGDYRNGDGYLVWDQVLPGELVLRYHQSDRYDIAHCEVVHRPDVVTPAQLLAVKQIEEDMGAIENAFGLDDRLSRLIERRAVAIEEAMADLPESLQPGADWDYQVLASTNGISVGDGRSWVNHAGPFDDYCEGREVQVVYVTPAADGELVVLAYYKWGDWNVNLLWRETTGTSPVSVKEEEPSELDMGAALQALKDQFGR